MPFYMRLYNFLHLFPKLKCNFIPLIRKKYLYMFPYLGIERDNNSPKKVKHENRNRQCKNRNRNPDRKRREDLRFEKIHRTQSESSCLRKLQKTRQIKLDQWGACNTPKVWRSIAMVSTPRENKEKRENKTFYENEKGRYLSQKELRAKIILSRENSIRKVNNNIYLVQSQTGHGWYKVQWNGKEWACNCPDNVKNGHISSCKHILALKIRYESGFYEIEEVPKIETKTYIQNWSFYNQAQIQEFELFDQFLCQLVSSIEEPDQYMGRPKLKMRDQIFCSIMKVYSQLSGRRAHCLYVQAMEKQQILHAPHFNAISKTLNKKEIQSILHDLVHLSAKPLASVETDFAIDSSGFRCSTFGSYCEEKHGTKRKRNWLKVHIITGINTNIVADVVITDEHSADSPQLKKLINNISKYFTINEISADMAYSSKKNLQLIDSFGGKPFIPFKKNATGNRSGALWRKTFHYFQLHKDEFLEHYHKRSNVESTFSAIKKKFGESVKSKNRIAQENELICKIIAYNITVLIHEMVQLNGTSEFLFINGLQKELT